MKFFFVFDHREKYRFLSSEPVQEIDVEFSRLKKIWAQAKKMLMLFPRRIMAQEQAFERVLDHSKKDFPILFSGRVDVKKIKRKFFFFLQRQRSKHVLILLVEILLLPISGIMVILPGPNVFFGVLALMMITHWQALRGINKLSRKNHLFIPEFSLNEWERAAEEKNEKNYPEILEKIAEEFNQKNIKKILWK